VEDFVTENTTYRTANFLLGIVTGALISFGISLLLAPQSGTETREMIKDHSLILKERVLNDRDHYSERIRSATDQWVAQLRATANEMVKRGYLTAEEANAQINSLLERVRG
jgi:gas vesicle protein